MATSYYRSNLIHQAYWLLREKSRRSPECRFLQAKCAYQLKKYSEAECALTNSNFGELKNFDEITKDFGEIACFVLQLIAQICAKTERKKISADALRKALKLNPFMWQAFADLCNLGENADANSIFQINSTDVFNSCQGNNNASSMIIFGLNDRSFGGFDSGVQNSYNIISNEQNLNNSSGYILSTPVDQMGPPPQSCGGGGVSVMGTTLQNLNTPINNNNYNNLNSSISMLRGTQHSGLALLEDTPVGGFTTTNDQTPSFNVNQQQQLDGGAGTPYRKQFKYLSTITPTTPSFGVLPINSPCGPNGNDSSFIGQSTVPILNITNSPSPQTLVEANQEKTGSRKMKSHVVNVISRKESIANNSSNKPAVFTQTGNITPRTPNNTGNIPTAGKIIKYIHYFV